MLYSGEQSSNFALLHLLTLTDVEEWGNVREFSLWAEPIRKGNIPMSIPKILQVLFLPVTISQNSNSSWDGVGEYRTF